jgi:hypothetical protein
LPERAAVAQAEPDGVRPEELVEVAELVQVQPGVAADEVLDLAPVGGGGL